MSVAEGLIAEFEEQAPFTRMFLERVPGDKLTWKPHEKSLTAGQLALHIAQVPGSVCDGPQRIISRFRRRGDRARTSWRVFCE